MSRKDRNWVKTLKAMAAVAVWAEEAVAGIPDEDESRRAPIRRKRRDAKRRASPRLRLA